MRRPRRIGVVVAALVVVALVAAEAFARAGGGGNFGGGGGGGRGGGSGGNGGGGRALFLLIQLLFRHPAIGIPITLIVIAFFVWQARNARKNYVGRVIGRGGAAIEAAHEEERVGTILGHDPAFDRTAFTARVSTAFVRAQRAWCAHDLTPIRAFVSDGVYERFALQIAEQRDLGYADRMDGLGVRSVTIAHVSMLGSYDAVTVRISAVAADYRVSLATGKRVSGSNAPEPFAELWTFLRRRGVKSSPGRPGLFEGNCPNCGNSVEGNQFADCKSCGSRLRSGEFDWVLTEITQPGEWMPRQAKYTPGVEELTAADPEFSAEAMEDRASVAFWRWAMAMRTADAKQLAGVAADEVVRGVASAVLPENGARRFVGECGVGGVELVGVLRDEGEDRALVEVRWSGTEFEVRQGESAKRLHRTGIRSSVFVFERPASARTRIADSFSSAHCGGCGAPAGGSSAVCSYCGQPLAAVNLGWTLTRITSRTEAAGRMLLDRLRLAPKTAEPPSLARADEPVPAGVVAWAARVAASDGVVDAKEREGLTNLAKRSGVSVSRLTEILADAVAPGTELPLPHTPEEARHWLELACRSALADGQVTPEEFALLKRLAAPANMAPADIRILMNRVRGDMFAEAKAALRRA